MNLNTEIRSIDEIRYQKFEAVYVATGKTDMILVLNQADGHCIIDGNIAVFAGGSLTGKDLMHAMADGLDMAWSIEVYLKTGRLEYPENGMPCKIT